MVDDDDQPPPAPRSVQFAEVEVIELPIVAGENHPSRLWKKKSQATVDTSDSAAITLGWEAQTRTTMNLNETISVMLNPTTPNPTPAVVKSGASFEGSTTGADVSTPSSARCNCSSMQSGAKRLDVDLAIVR